QYLTALEREISRCGEFLREAGLTFADSGDVDSIYLGGGTPGLLSGTQMARLLDAVRGGFTVSSDAEITIEASPENISAKGARQWAACGVNRVSLGAQSMCTPELRAVGRMHDATTVVTAVDLLRQIRIENISIDLIAGLPHQTESSWEQTLAAVLDLKVPH